MRKTKQSLDVLPQTFPLSPQHAPCLLLGLFFFLMPGWTDGLNCHWQDSLTEAFLVIFPHYVQSYREFRGKTPICRNSAMELILQLDKLESRNSASTMIGEAEEKSTSGYHIPSSYQYGYQCTDEGCQRGNWGKDRMLELLNQTTCHGGPGNLVGIKKFQFQT